MKVVRFAASALAAACLMSVACGGPAQACQLLQVAEMPVTMQGNLPLVDVSLNGRPVRFLVDTGNATTFLSQAAAQQLGLKPVPRSGVTVYGEGGASGASTAKIRDFKLGSMIGHDIDLMVTDRLRSTDFAGLLGRDFLLNHYDLELDLAHHVVRLLEPKDCHGDGVVYWAQSYSMASIDSGSLGINVVATLNGRSVSALLHSGASHSFVTPDAARAAGATLQSHGVADAGMSSGASEAVQARTGTFQTLEVGGEVINKAELELADLFSTDQQVETGSHIKTDAVELPAIVLGVDFIKAHHLYVARSQGKLYFTYNGGRIFDMPEAKAGDGAAAPSPVGPQKPEAPSSQP